MFFHFDLFFQGMRQAGVALPARVTFAKDVLDSGATLQSVSEALCHKSMETTRGYYKRDNQSLSLTQRVKAAHIGYLKEPGAERHGSNELDLEDFDFDAVDDAFFEGSCSFSSSSSKASGLITEPISVPPTIPVSVVAPPPAMAPVPCLFSTCILGIIRSGGFLG